MAPAPAPRKGLNLRQPGAKEYAVIGGAALAVGLVYFWWKKRQASTAAPAAAATDTSGTTAPATPTGLNTAQLLAWIQDHSSSSTTTTTGAPTGTTQGGTIPVPAVTGERANAAISKLQAAGLGYRSTGGSRNPAKTYTVSAQNPAAGTKVAPDTPVALTFKMQQV